MKAFVVLVFAAAIFACILADDDATDDVTAEKTDADETAETTVDVKPEKNMRQSLDPPDPVNPPDKYGYKPDIYESEHNQYTSEHDQYAPEHNTYPQPEPEYSHTPDYEAPDYDHKPDDYGKPGKYDYGKPDIHDYGKPGKYDYGTPDKHDYDKPDKYDYGKPGGIYPPIDPPGPVCKAHNICEKRGYKCCACADCNSESFGCAETCACCPSNSVCCKSGLTNHFCCPRGSQCDNVSGTCIVIKKVKSTKAHISCGKCDYYEDKPVY